MPNFKKYSYKQSAMVVVDFEQQLRPNTFEFTLHHLIDNHIELSAFYDKYRNDGGGRTAYDPAIMLKIILFAYYKGVRSSRDIQWECEHNIIFKALSCDTVPHFTGIASFISSHPDAIESVFEQVLLVCDQQGLLGNELIAIDGCKMPSDAAKEHSGTLDELSAKREKIQQQIKHCMREHQHADKSEPKAQERKAQLEQSLTTLGKHFAKLDAFLKDATPRMGQGKKPKEVKSNITDNESGKMRTSKGTIQGYNGVAAVDKKHQIIVDAQVFGEAQEHHTLTPVLESIKSRYQRTGISDDILQEQIIITADTGFSNEKNNEYLQSEGINAYIPDNQFRSRDPKFAKQKEKHGKRHRESLKGIKTVIPSSEFEFDIKNKRCRCPMGKSLWLKNEKLEANGKLKLSFEANLTDCRHCEIKTKCMRNPSSADTREGHGRQTSITVNTKRTATDWMKARVDSQLGKKVYGHRMSVVEPVFGNIGTNRKLNRFSLRSKKKVQGQWQLYSLVHNIEKLMRYAAIA